MNTMFDIENSIPPTQERLARIHKDNIIYALRVLEEATSGEIKKFIDEKVDKELHEKYDNSRSMYLTYSEEFITREKANYVKWHKTSKKTIQNWLPRLEKEQLVKKNRYHVYSLTSKGNKISIFDGIYGNILFGRLANLPVYQTKEENLVEFVKRFGAYIFYIFLSNLKPPTTMKRMSMSAEEFNRGALDMFDEAISPSFMFLRVFRDIFLSSKEDKSKSIEKQRQSYLLFNQETYDKLINTFKKEFPEYYENLEESTKIFYDKVVNPAIRDK